MILINKWILQVLVITGLGLIVLLGVLSLQYQRDSAVALDLKSHEHDRESINSAFVYTAAKGQLIDDLVAGKRTSREVVALFYAITMLGEQASHEGLCNPHDLFLSSAPWSVRHQVFRHFSAAVMCDSQMGYEEQDCRLALLKSELQNDCAGAADYQEVEDLLRDLDEVTLCAMQSRVARMPDER